MTVDRAEITRLMSEAVGPEHLSSSTADTAAHALDFWPRALIRARDEQWPGGPAWVVRPGATAEVSQVLRTASTYAIPVVPHGAGSSLVGGAAPPPQGAFIALSTQRMNTILDFDETSLRVHAQAGIVGVELEEWLNARGYSLGHVPTSMSSATLGGWLSTRSAGLLSSRYGRITDLCLGATAVLADGEVVQTRPAPRRAAGPELLQLLLGSEGTVGVICSAELSVHRLPLHRQFESFAFPSLTDAAAALRAVLGLGIQPLLARAERDPRVAGRPEPGAKARQSEHPAVRAAGGEEARQWLVVLAFEGPPDRVEAELAAARRAATGHGGTSLGPAPARRWWGQRFAGVFHFGPHLAAAGGVADQVDLGAPWSRVAPLANAVTTALGELGLSMHLVLDHGQPEGACLCVQFWGTAGEQDTALDLYDRAWDSLAKVVQEQGGWLGHVFGAGRHRATLLEPEARARLALLAAVKRRLDPANVLNPGVLGTDP